MARNTYLTKVLGTERYQELQNTTVVMIGAGGIGCELLKNLILSGYGCIHIVDLDTITLSNLNRQFLFRQKDIDKSKSLTIKKAVESFNYHGCKLISHHGNITDTTQFPISWWSQFSFIFNALDNLEARRYVNRMALFLKTPIMESGTTGYDGYVQPIYPYQAECFDCQAKVTPQTFPVCTIRSTPSKPIHCITWAKEFLFHQLFDETDEDPDSAATSLGQATDNKEELETLVKESNELADLRRSLLEKNNKTFFKGMVEKLFDIDIERLLLIDTLWQNRQRPTPLKFNEELSEKLFKLTIKDIKQDTEKWDILENLFILYQATSKLQERLKQMEGVDENRFISFDKDDEDTLDFVVASANLRSSIFNIDILSKFDIKQIAGNIIPAIATTNAIISGFSNLQSLNYFQNKNDESIDSSSMVFISIRPNKYVTSAALEPPRNECGSCSVARGILELENLTNQSLEELIEILKDTYKYSSDISLILGKSKLIYDFDFEDNLHKKLQEIGFTNGEVLLIQDEDEEKENLELYINVGDKFEVPSIELRDRKKIVKPEENGETNEEDFEESNKAFETILIDDEDVEDKENKENKVEKVDKVEEEEDVVEELVEEPASKKQRMS
ncbi:ubiquitin-activating enzyme E1-like [[Candida] anglica]|uniref:Ubiquitin-activating enzyme E1-like n=1 Tax=[Candida] anglica TaxID=148631 RepID=A0ABP0EMC0_9ASCO